MKTCSKCNTIMVENLELRTNDAIGLCVGEKGIFGKMLGKVSCSVCPECGHIELCLDNLDKVKKLANK